MIDNLSFINNNWFWQIVCASLLLWLVFAWKEWKQEKKSKLYLKLFFGVLAISSLAIIILKPILTTDLKTYELAILTTDFSEEKLDSLKALNKNLKTHPYKINEPFIESNNIPSSIYILGEGIAPFDFWQLDSLNTTYIGTTKPSGITKLNYNPNQILGKSLNINGQYVDAKKGTKLILQDAAKNTLDSLIFENDSTYNFKFSTKLSVLGNFEYHLVEKDSLETIQSSNPFGVSIKAENALRILIINDFPTFETKYLKNYLSEKSHKLVVRSQITRDKFKYEYFNLTTKPSINFSKKSLDEFDLVIVDAQSFRNFGNQTKENLEHAIRINGLGLYIQNPSFRKSINYFTEFNFIADKNSITRLENWPNTKVTKHYFNFNDVFTLQPIHKTNDKILSAYKPLEAGRIGTSTFNNTFELLLNGNAKVYQDLWSNIINALSKKQVSLASFNSNTIITYKDEPYNFNLRTTIKNPIVFAKNQQHIALRNDIDINSLWKGKTYPKKRGWQTLYLKQDSTQFYNFYVADTMHWKSLRTQQTTEANKRQFQNLKPANTIYTTQKPMQLFWLYLIFLLSIGYLWLEPKL